MSGTVQFFDVGMSAVQSVLKSPVQSRLRIRAMTNPTQVWISMVPIWGYGTFTSASSGPAGLFYNEVWPNVYSTLTQVWSDQGGTTTFVDGFQPFWDAPNLATAKTYTGTQPTGGTGAYWNGSAPGIVRNSVWGATTVTDTTVTTAYTFEYLTYVNYVATWNNGSGTYTATLSGLQGLGNWSALTAQSVSLLANVALATNGAGIPANGQYDPNTGTFSYNWAAVAPTQAAPGYTIVILNPGECPSVAAMLGIPCRLAVLGTPGFGIPGTTASANLILPTIQTIAPRAWGMSGGTYPGYLASAQPNIGVCASLKSCCVMNGLLPAATGAGPKYYLYDLWQQAIIPGSPFTAGVPSRALGLSTPYLFQSGQFYSWDTPDLATAQGIIAWRKSVA